MFHVKHRLWCRWCSGCRGALLWRRAAVCAGGWRPAREIAIREPAARRVDSLSGQAPPPPTGTATVLRVVGLPISSARSGTFNSGGTIALPDSTSVYGYEVVNQSS